MTAKKEFVKKVLDEYKKQFMKFRTGNPKLTWVKVVDKHYPFLKDIIPLARVVALKEVKELKEQCFNGEFMNDLNYLAFGMAVYNWLKELSKQ